MSREQDSVAVPYTISTDLGRSLEWVLRNRDAYGFTGDDRNLRDYREAAKQFFDVHGNAIAALTREAAPQASGGDELPCTDSDNCRRCSEDADTPHSGIPRGTLATTDSAHPQASVYVACRQCDNCGHAGINDESPTNAACHECDWHGPSPAEDHCPGCNRTSCMGAACPRCQSIYRLVADNDIPATTDSAIQSQQGATGGVVDAHQLAAIEHGQVASRLIYGFMLDCNAVGLLGAAENLHKGIKQHVHPQAAGSAPGEVLHPAHTVEAAKRAFNIDPAGSVASGAGEFHIEHIDADHVRLTPIATAAGSAPVGVDAKDAARRVALALAAQFDEMAEAACKDSEYDRHDVWRNAASQAHRRANDPDWIDAALEKERAE